MGTIFNENIRRYIKNEKDISRYKISKIKNRKAVTPSQERILSIERGFISLPLEEMKFEDVADVAAAISIYRNSRVSFYKTYDVPKYICIDREKITLTITEKLTFIKNKGLELMNTRVQEINPVQSSDFYFDLVKRQSIKNGTSIDFEKRSLDIMTLNDLISIEPSVISKKRARTQVSVYSIGKYLYEEALGLKVLDGSSLEELRDTDLKVDKIIDKIRFNIFKYYNFALKILPSILKNTMGENHYISKLHELQNVLDFKVVRINNCSPIHSHDSFGMDNPRLGNISFSVKKVINSTLEGDSGRGVRNRVYGILLPIPRKGNEKMSLLYKNIFIDGVDIGPMFSDSISNVMAINENSEEEYFKAILMEPLWILVDLAKSDISSLNILTKLLSVEKDYFRSINFNDKDMVDKINNTHTGFLKLSNESVVLIPKTRSEEEGLLEIYPILHSKILEIRDDYNRMIANNNVFVD